MEWYNIIIAILGAVGGTGGVISIYTAKAKRDGMVTDSMQKIIDEAQEEREALRTLHNEYVEKTDKRIENLDKNIDQLRKDNIVNMRIISTAYRCRLAEKPEDCPVLRTLNDECAKNEGVCIIK